jgi:Ca-activated chloride channel family protein
VRCDSSRRYRALVTVLVFLISLIFTASEFGQSSREISFNVTVVDDKGGIAAGLKREWFSIVENKSQLPISGFETPNEPASVVVLVDFSNSASADSRKASIQAVSHFISAANPENDYLIVAFNKEVTMIADWGRDQSSIEKQLNEAAQREAKDGTALYDACNLGLTRLAASKYPSRVLLLLSDGQDNGSKLTFNKLRDEIKESSVVLYAIGAMARFSDSSALGMEGQGILGELSTISGGDSFYPRSDKDMLAIAEQISLELRNRYRISFKPTSATPDDKWHAVKIKLTLPERDDKGRKFGHVNIHSRLGYYDR